MDKQDFQNSCLMLGIIGLWAGCINFTYIYVYAMLSGGKAVVNVNLIGEMWYEVALMIFFLPFMVYTAWYIARGGKNE